MPSTTTQFTEPQLDALASLRDAAAKSRWAVIGASAILCRLPLQRLTYDIDLAVASSGAELSEALTTAGWKRSERMRQRWERDRVQVDIVHATDADIANSVADLGDGFELTVIGFDLAYDEVDPIALRGDLVVPATRLHAIVLLKMIAWLDREERSKDLEDIFFLWDNGLPADDAFRHDQEHPVGAAGLEYDDHGAFYVGWLLGQVARPTHLHWARRFLDKMRDDEGASFARFVRASRVPGDDREQRVRARINAFEQGLDTGAASAAARGLPERPARRAAAVPLRDARARILHDAIDQQRMVRFRTQGRLRVVEPHVLGIHDGSMQLLSYQVDGVSPSGPLPDWRRFRVSDIVDLEILDQQFAGSRATSGTHSPFDRHIAIVRRREARAARPGR